MLQVKVSCLMTEAACMSAYATGSSVSPHGRLRLRMAVEADLVESAPVLPR